MEDRETGRQGNGETSKAISSSQIASASGARLPIIFPALAAIIALIGLGDAIYLTVHHLNGEKVPCSIVAGCETVLSSEYATIAGIPLGVFGGAAYFLAFSFAILAIFGNYKTWFLLGVQVVLMFLFTLWLLYLQAFVIGAFCQFCLLSALTTTLLTIITVISKFWRYSKG